MAILQTIRERRDDTKTGMNDNRARCREIPIHTPSEALEWQGAREEPYGPVDIAPACDIVQVSQPTCG